MKSYILKCLYKSYKKSFPIKPQTKEIWKLILQQIFKWSWPLSFISFRSTKAHASIPSGLKSLRRFKKKLKCFYRNWNTFRSKMILSPYFYSRTCVGWLVLGDHRNFKPKGKLIKSSILFTIYIFYRNYRYTQIVIFQQYISYKRYLNIRRQNSSKLKLPGLK